MKTILFLMLAILAAGLANAKNADPALIDRIKNFYENASSFSAPFDQVLVHKESGARDKRTGQLYFQKPLRVRWQTARPNEEILVITDSEVWDYLPDEEIVYKYAPSVVSDSAGIIQVLTGQASLNRDFDVKDAGRENGLAKLRLYPHEPSTQLVEAIVWVDEKEGIIRRARIIDFYGNENEVSFRNFKANAEVKADHFKFPAPKNVEIEDRTSGDNSRRVLFQ